jgi:hypothetical protein
MRDPFLAQEIVAAVAESDAAFDFCEASEAQYAEHLKTRSGDLGLIYKTTEQPPPGQPTMDAATEERWNAWCDARIEKMMHDVFKDAIVEFVGDYVHRHLKPMHEEIAALRADLTVQTAIARGEIAQIKGKADAA